MPMSSYRCAVLYCVSFILFALGAIFSPAPLAAAPPLNLVFCCRADNDLYRIASMHGARHARYDAPGDAVKAATEGSGVLILADGYPEKTTVVEPAVFEEAARKKLPQPRSPLALSVESRTLVTAAPLPASVESWRLVMPAPSPLKLPLR